MMRAFLSIPVQGSRLEQNVYDAIVSGMANAGLTIINAEVNRPPALDEVAQISPYVVYAHNRALLEGAALVIAEVSRPSLGVGYELAVAEQKQIPLLALCDAAVLPSMSLMIRGLCHEHFHLATYANTAEISGMIAEFVSRQAGPRRRDSSPVIQHFDHIATVYDESTEWRQDEQLLQWLASRVAGRARCLDVGTGTGLVGSRVRLNGSVVIGVDRSAAMLRHAVGRLCLAVQGDAASLPFQQETFDGVLLRSVLHYLDDLRCLREVRRVMRTDAVIVCAQATGADIESAAWWEMLKRKTQPLRERYYTADALIRAFTTAGFHVAESVSMRIAREESWPAMLRHCSGLDRDLVRTMIRDVPSRVRETARMRISDEGVSYEQHWTLLCARPA